MILRNIQVDPDDIRVYIQNQYLYLFRISEISGEITGENITVTKSLIENPGNSNFYLEGTKHYVVTDKKVIDLLYLDKDLEMDVFNTIYVLKDGEHKILKDPINVLRNSYSSKLSYGGIINQVNSGDVICKIFKHFSDSPLEETEIEFKLNPNAFLQKDLNIEEITRPVQNRQHRFKLTVPDTLEVDKTLEVTAQMISVYGEPIKKEGVEVYLKSNMGYLPYNKKVTDADGKVKFKFTALGLEKGDIATLKFGFKFFSSINIKNIEII